MNPRVFCLPPAYSDAHVVRIKTVISLPWISCGDNFPLYLLAQSQRITCTRCLTVPVFPGWISSISNRLSRQSGESAGCVCDMQRGSCFCWLVVLPGMMSVYGLRVSTVPRVCQSARNNPLTLFLQELWSLHKHSSMSGNKWCFGTIFVGGCSVFIFVFPLLNKFVSQSVVSEASQNFMNLNRLLVLSSKSDYN